MKVGQLIFCIALPLACTKVQAQKKLYISNDDHTDYLWTAEESQYTTAFIHMLDYYIAQSDQTAGLPDAWQSRFNCDGNFWLWEYEKHKSAAEFQKLISKIRSGHISVPYNALVSCYGAAPMEGILRGMYYAGYLERKFDLDLDLAVAMEDQTLPLGLSSLWAGSGAKYSWKGVCDCISRVKDLQNRNKEIYWYTGLDGSAILMKWYSLSPEGNKHLGGYSESRDPGVAVEELTALCGAKNYPYKIAGAFGYGWDDLKTTTDIFTTTAKQKSDSGRQVIVSNESDFFRAFNDAYGKTLPRESLSYGNEWDLYSASLAEVSAQVKRSVEKLRAAEAMASMVSLHNNDFASSLSDMRQTAWMALGLYYEHDWTSDGPVEKPVRAAWQRKIQGQLTAYVDSLYVSAQQQLGTFIRKRGNKTRFYAFNPLGWTRTDFCDFIYSGSEFIHVVDIASGKEVSSQFILENGKRFVRILAKDIPGVGYKIFEIRPGKPTALSLAASIGKNEIENDFYRIRLTGQGVITSLIDKRNENRQWVRQVNGKWMNDLGSGADSSGICKVEQSGPVSVTFLCSGTTPLAHTSRITLYNDIPRIDIRNDLTQNFDSVYSWAFSYDLENAEVSHEESGAVLLAKPVADGGHYATDHARLDWLTLNHFVDIHNATAGFTLSNSDCAFMKPGTSALTYLDTTTPQLSVLAGGQVDGPGPGIRKQGGDHIFTQRFAIGTHKDFAASTAMRFAMEHQNPLVSGEVTGTQPSYPEKIYSFLTISDAHVLLWSLKPAEEGISHGLIARVWNLADDDVHVKISLTPDLISARETTHVETDLRDARVVDGDLQETVGHRQIKTYRMLLKQ